MEELLPVHSPPRSLFLLFPLLFPLFPLSTVVTQLPSRGESDGLSCAAKQSKPLQMNFREVLRSLRVGSNVLRSVLSCDLK